MNPKQKIGTIVADNYKTANIFRKFGIDFCCGGDRSIRKACREKNIKQEKLIKVLESIGTDSKKNKNYQKMEIDSLIDHIIDSHHSYVKNKMPDIGPLLSKIVHVHEDNHPELLKVKKLFKKLEKEINAHLKKEENDLFPALRLLASNKTSQNIHSVEKTKKLVNSTENEHDVVGHIFKQINKITDNLKVPDDACQTYKVVFSMLKDLESDIYQHIHLENNILFPKTKNILKNTTG